ncbi:MAG: hypothetical protein ACH350_03850 [Parachlamydiaceae bacterium]
MTIFSLRQLTLGLTMTVMACSAAAFADHDHRHDRRHDRRQERRHDRKHQRRSSSDSISISSSHRDCFSLILLNKLQEETSDLFGGYFYALNQIIEEWGATPDKNPDTNEALAAFIAANEETASAIVDAISVILHRLDVPQADIEAIEALFAAYNTTALAYVYCLNYDNAPLVSAIACSEASTYAAFEQAATNLGEALAIISCDLSFVNRIETLAYLQGQLAQTALGVLVYGSINPSDPSSEGAAEVALALEILQEAKSIGADLIPQIAHCQCKRLHD